MDILSKAEEWSLLYGDKLSASATTRFPTLYKGAVGGLEHVISVDNGGAYFELWREGESWYATTGAAIKELPGLAKGAKLDEALDQFFKLTSKVSKAAVRKHQDSSGSTAHHKTGSQQYNDRMARIGENNPGCGHFPCTPEKAARDHPNGTHQNGTPIKKAQQSCPKCKTMPKDYRSASGHLANDPKTGATVLEPHEPRVKKATKHGKEGTKHSHSTQDKTAGNVSYSHSHVPASHSFGTRVKKSTTYGPSTPHDKPHGGSYNSLVGASGHMQHHGKRVSYANYGTPGLGRHIHKPHGTKTKPYSHSHPAGRVHKAVAQVGPDLKIGHKTPSNVSGGNVNPMENKGAGRSPDAHRHERSDGSGALAHIHPNSPKIRPGHKHKGMSGATHYMKKMPRQSSLGQFKDYKVSAKQPKNSLMPKWEKPVKKGRKPIGHIGQHGQDCKICAKKNTKFTESWQKTHPSATNKMVRMTIKDLRQLVGKGKGYLHGSRMYDSGTSHGRAGSYHSHNESPRPGNSSETSSHEHRKGSHGPVPRGVRKADTVSGVSPHKGGLHRHPDLSAKKRGKTYVHEHEPSKGHGFGMQYDGAGGWKSPFQKNIMGLDTPEAPQRSTYQSHGGTHSHSGFPNTEDYTHEHEKGTHSPLGDYPGASFPARKEGKADRQTTPRTTEHGVGGQVHTHSKRPEEQFPAGGPNYGEFHSHTHGPSTHPERWGPKGDYYRYSKAARVKKLTQGGRISGGITTPEVARTGGAGQPVGYGSSGSPQYSYGRKAVKAKEDNCATCSEVAKAVAMVDKLTQDEFERTHPVKRHGHGDPSKPSYHTHQTYGSTPHSHSDFPKKALSSARHKESNA